MSQDRVFTLMLAFAVALGIWGTVGLERMRGWRYQQEAAAARARSGVVYAAKYAELEAKANVTSAIRQRTQEIQHLRSLLQSPCLASLEAGL